MSKTFYPTIFKSTMPDIFNAFDYMFDDLNLMPRRHQHRTGDIPRANIIKSDRGHTIELAVPGYSRGDFDLNVNNKTLSISVSSEDSKEYRDSLVSREYSLDTWTRSWVLPEGSNVEQIAARYEAGILYVEIPNEMKMDNKRQIMVD